MRKTIIITILLLLSVFSKPLLAAEEGEKGAASRAYERASEQAIFHRVSDWFATVGKSPQQKTRMLEQRRARRAAKRAQREFRKSQKKMEKIKGQEGSVTIRERQTQRERQRGRGTERLKTRTKQKTRTR